MHGVSCSAGSTAKCGSGAFDWGGYFNTQHLADPAENTVGVLMEHTQGGNDETGWKFRQLVSQMMDD